MEYKHWLLAALLALHTVFAASHDVEGEDKGNGDDEDNGGDDGGGNGGGLSSIYTECTSRRDPAAGPHRCFGVGRCVSAALAAEGFDSPNDLCFCSVKYRGGSCSTFLNDVFASEDFADFHVYLDEAAPFDMMNPADEHQSKFVELIEQSPTPVTQFKEVYPDKAFEYSPAFQVGLYLTKDLESCMAVCSVVNYLQEEQKDTPFDSPVHRCTSVVWHASESQPDAGVCELVAVKPVSACKDKLVERAGYVTAHLRPIRHFYFGCN